MKLKKNTYYVLLLLSIALALRVYGATRVPLIYDEENYVKAAKEIKLFPNIFNLQVKGVTSIRSPDESWNTNKEGMVRYYLFTLMSVNLSQALFADSVLGTRMLFILLSILGLFFIYKAVEDNLGDKTAMLTLVILVFSQLHIGISRLALHSPFHFFVALSIYAFFKALKTKQMKWAYLTGISLALGFICYALMALMALVFLAFLVIEKEYRFCLRKRTTYAVIFMVFFLVTPYLLLNINALIYKMTVDKSVFQVGISLRACYLYFADIFVKLSDNIAILRWDGLQEKLFACTTGGLKLLGDIELEFPVMDWILSLVIFSGLFYGFKHKKNEFIRFNLLMFCCFFIIISLVNRGVLFLDYSWADITLYPGVILCANMFVELRKKSLVVSFMIAALAIYLVLNALYFVRIPENFYAIPKDELSKLYLRKAKMYLSNRENKKAEIIFNLLKN